jgi:hypothetical protein
MASGAMTQLQGWGWPIARKDRGIALSGAICSTGAAASPRPKRNAADEPDEFQAHAPSIRRRVALRGRDGARNRGDDRGHLVGSGTGRVEGPGISGTVRWSNFEQVFADPAQRRRGDDRNRRRTGDSVRLTGLRTAADGSRRVERWLRRCALLSTTRATAGLRRCRRSGRASLTRRPRPLGTVRTSPLGRATMNSRRHRWRQAHTKRASACAWTA